MDSRSPDAPAGADLKSPPGGGLVSGAPVARGAEGLPPDASQVNLLDVDYVHCRTGDGGDLYLTSYGLPFWQHLQPENWYAREWFEAKRQRLVGTSVVYKVPTRSLRGRRLHLVVKWSRVGEEVPLDTLTINKFINAEFNSPFEEFSLLMELRSRETGPGGIRIRTQRPLAIYVPPERLQLWQTGRSESKIAAKIKRAPGVELDILRQYVVLYGWIRGFDVVDVADLWKLGPNEREELYARTTSLVNHELGQKGYRVVDMKPAHIIVRPKEGRHSLSRDKNGQLLYALVDYELLVRTPDHEAAVRKVHRRHYLQHMAKRFETGTDKSLPAHLKAANVLGVDYVFGHAESTGGLLWVVGRDPNLFNYFLPERWRRTPKTALSLTHQVFYTRTKDNIHLVWRISRMGDTPAIPLSHPRFRDIREHGYNSPFEEFTLALRIGEGKVKTIYPRAIYMTGHRTDGARRQVANDRYAKFRHWRTPDQEPVLRQEHDYITIWGFWNGPDELLAAHDMQHFQGINAEQALRDRRIDQATHQELLESTAARLHHQGFEDLNLKPDHLLLSVGPDNLLVRNTLGKPEVRLCNFELIRELLPPR
ncbi:MAG: hypothetical protein JXQ71_04845 [Verrucomicrobia bacterium]|nr:hypothetical protein [Verrucomicrobiota bacterium]